MNKYQYTEMEDIFESYGWLFRQRFEELDHLSRKMFTDMSLARVKHQVAVQFVGEKLTALIAEIVKERRCIRLRKTINLGEVRQSIKELTRIYKPEVSKVDQFVKRFVLKYNVTKGYEDELRKIVLNELESIKQA